MSLHGLSSPSVTEAYQATLTDSSGWFWLHYVSRDEVEVLARGTGGCSEASSALEKYTEKSPLFGLLLYRRRKILLKYVPNGTSRLLQARTNVHFSTVSETLSPYDVVLNLTAAADLNEPALAAIASLHRASSLHSFSSSLRRPNLSEITEAAEEVRNPNDTVPNFSRELAAQEILAKQDNTKQVNGLIYETIECEAFNASKAEPLSGQGSGQDEKATLPSAATIPTPNTQLLTATPAHLHSTVNSGEERPETSDKFEPMRRTSEEIMASYNPRPSTSDLFKYGIWKQKIKLSPRPVAEGAAKQPRSSGTIRQRLPAGLRLRRKDTDRPTSRMSQQSNVSITSRTDNSTDVLMSTRPPVPVLPIFSDKATTPPPRPATRMASGSNNELTSTVNSDGSASMVTLNSITTPEQDIMSPERKRLMRALQLRKDQLNASREPLTIPLANPVRTDSAVGINDDKVQFRPASIQDGEYALADHVSENTYSGHVLQQHLRNGTIPSTLAAVIVPAAVVTNGIGSDVAVLSKHEDLEFPSSRITNGHVNGIYKGVERLSTKSTHVVSHTDLQESKHGVADFLSLETIADEVDDNSVLDESLFRDLQNAKLQEAQPVFIPNMPNKVSLSPKLKDREHGARFHNSSSGVTPPSVISPSLAAGQERTLLSTIFNTASSKAVHMQALAEVPSREPSPSISHDSSASSLLGLHRSSLRAPSEPQPFLGAKRTNSRSTSPTQAHYTSTSHLIYSNYQHNDIANPTHSAIETHGGFHSVPFTAGIVRDKFVRTDESDPISMDFQRSPHVMARQPGPHLRTASALSNHTSYRPPTVLSQRPASREASLSVMTKHSRQSNDSGWRSLSPWRSNKSGPKPPPIPSTNYSLSNGSLDRVAELGDDRKQSMTTRLWKRISGQPSPARKPLAEVHVEDVITHVPKHMRRPSAIVIGDLNVQFPDTLLWQRRWLEVDASGNLVLDASRANERARTPRRRYHLSEFKPPYTPSQDRQELHYSIIFDFIDGSTLQLACEDPSAQAQVYRILRDLHHAWIVYGE